MRLILLLFVFGISCSTQKNYSDKNKIESKLKQFVTWYSNNWDSLAVDLIEPIIENSMTIPNDSMKAYNVNFEKAEIYLEVFRQSGFVSNEYIDSYRQYFKKCQDDFIKNPQTMGPAEGFTGDFIYKGQDYGFQVENPDKAVVKDIKITADKAVATVSFGERINYLYDLTKKGDDWLIDRIR